MIIAAPDVGMLIAHRWSLLNEPDTIVTSLFIITNVCSPSYDVKYFQARSMLPVSPVMRPVVKTGTPMLAAMSCKPS